ncbi:fumarylacetoacetate hydrolase family protein [Natrarchaeobius chitinivorans]|uniref:Fumarylacetoacetate hydrolase family protein n=1 Tax=Natrarchaeobius chitinivorans TaxID=1679083 RepID=A0A3N6MLZ8_NATCH|nr:fumarylacetoacetate hydrolase family protein [Natrarchaeobius chitinivorans]RQG95436.1 fumarylacetoacetate hydrolase family protein [Natrarchaeobius chitinivorans]
MQFASFEVRTRVGTERRVGVLREETLVDVTEGYAGLLAERGEQAPQRLANAIAPPDMLQFLKVGERAREAAEEAVSFVDGTDAETGPSAAQYQYGLDDVRLLSPLPRPNSIRDFIAFEDHIGHFAPSIPDEWYELPVYYKGNPDSVLAPGETIEWPTYTEKLDYELELAAVIGMPGRNIPVEEAMDHVFGFTLFNDFSARDIQSKERRVGLGPSKAKDFANGFGPVLVTADELDIDDTELRLRINGETHCVGNLGDMYHSFDEIVAHASKHEMLQPGDVLGSGTVGGGSGPENGRWPEPGDLITLEAEVIGTLEHEIGSP